MDESHGCNSPPKVPLAPAGGDNKATGNEDESDREVPVTQFAHQRKVAAGDVKDHDPQQPKEEQPDHQGRDPRLRTDLDSLALGDG